MGSETEKENEQLRHNLNIAIKAMWELKNCSDEAREEIFWDYRDEIEYE